MIYAVTVYCDLGPKLGCVIRKCLASLGVKSLEARWSSTSKSISEVKGYSYWKCNEFLPLVMLALGDQRRLSNGFCPNSLHILSWNLWEGNGRTVPNNSRTKPYWPALHHLFCYRLYWCGDAWKEHLSTSSCWSYCGQENTQGHAQALRWQVFTPEVLTWVAFWKVTLIAFWVTSEASKVLMVRNWTSVWDAIRSTPVLLHSILVVEQGGISTAPVSVRVRLSLTRDGKLQCKVCLHPHLEQGGMPPVERWCWSLFFSLTDGS